MTVVQNANFPLRERNLHAVFLDRAPNRMHEIGADTVLAIINGLHPEFHQNVDAGLAETGDFRIGPQFDR